MVRLVANARRHVRADNNRDHSLHNTSQNTHICFLLELRFANIENLSSRNSLVLKHIVINQVNLLSRKRVFNFAHVVFKYFG